MRISFFEEFPSERNLAKLRMIDFPCKVYVAAKNIKEFFGLREKIKHINEKAEAIYWPILEKKEGYWISPFSCSKPLLRIFREFKKNKTKVMLDLELPLRRILLMKNIFSFKKNKERIKQFIQRMRNNVVLAEHAFSDFFLKLLGISYEARKIKMFYSSMRRGSRKKKEKILEKICRKNKIVALGLIAKGIKGNEKILTAAELERDLRIAKANNVEEVVIYRLGGLNNSYLRAIRRAW